MIRFLFLLAIAYGIYWGYNNFNFNLETFKSDTIQAFKKEKTVNIVNERRSQTQEEIDEILNN